MNTLFLPAHFFLAVKGAQAQEAVALHLAPKMVELEQEAEATNRRNGSEDGGRSSRGEGHDAAVGGRTGGGGGDAGDNAAGRDEDGGDRESDKGEESTDAEADWFENLVSIQAMALFGVTLAVNLFAFRLLAKGAASGTEGQGQGDGDGHGGEVKTVEKGRKASTGSEVGI